MGFGEKEGSWVEGKLVEKAFFNRQLLALQRFQFSMGPFQFGRKKLQRSLQRSPPPPLGIHSMPFWQRRRNESIQAAAAAAAESDKAGRSTSVSLDDVKGRQQTR
jgi:hypothetical protein